MTARPTIILYGAMPGFGLPSFSAYATKTEVQLKMAGLPYRTVPANPAAGPKGKIPYIDDAGEIVADSTFIRAHIERKYGIDLDAGLDARARAEAWAIERMLEDHLGWASAHARFLIPENFEKGPARWFDQAPEADRPRLRVELVANVAAAQRAHGLGRHTVEEIAGLAGRSLSALSVLLGERPFLMGDRESGVDATAFATLAAILTPFFDSPVRRRAEGFPNLVAYAGRMMRRHYPDHPWVPAAPDAAS